MYISKCAINPSVRDESSVFLDIYIYISHTLGSMEKNKKYARTEQIHSTQLIVHT
jgi:hypothetical protein